MMFMTIIQALVFSFVFLLATAFIAGLVWCLCTAVTHAKYLKLEANHLQKIIEDQENEHAQIH
ncbi:hypothetical protein EGT73_14030 [Acinetobacter johnsonii]|uniref:Uncharacterized protein n=1 Tax=Acinetobacter johnsonii TaxID=40214 RepID=A0A3R9FKZ1_ACIJO|nr:hypothetical protein EGT73_14030 [Acinetobacter johnsonii]